MHHVAIIVSCEDSLKFYRKLGFDEQNRIERENDYVVFLYGHDVILEMFVDARYSGKPKNETCGLRHLGIAVENIDEIAMEFDIKDSFYISWFGKRYFMVKDLDGQIIEIMEQ